VAGGVNGECHHWWAVRHARREARWRTIHGPCHWPMAAHRGADLHSGRPWGRLQSRITYRGVRRKPRHG